MAFSPIIPIIILLLSLETKVAKDLDLDITITILKNNNSVLKLHLIHLNVIKTSTLVTYYIR